MNYTDTVMVYSSVIMHFFFFLLFTDLVPATWYWKSIRTLEKKKKMSVRADNRFSIAQINVLKW